MIGHAALLYRTESTERQLFRSIELVSGGLPGKFNEGTFICPDYGKYTLSADGNSRRLFASRTFWVHDAVLRNPSG